ncbi:MAG: 1-acyl-sn-glycerol-3-phosphate acyltransferase [Myxococcales bacterium]|nr:1-acyl-sn-glycerol-3-phosphate acyltransferase [Myxococcales bacterium]MCB9691768.1 1-acyl-sn-glycerol-3-phosphate acyltransferase [Alphaproteobacteria bacterium]
MGNSLAGWIRLVVGLVIIGVNTTICMLVCALLIPWRVARIKTCNYYGKITGPMVMKVSGCPMTFVGTEHLDAERPAIYISNHTSIVDIFLAIQLSPVGTVGVAKKQVVYYPFFGLLYLLSGHLRIDRGHSQKAKESLAALGEYVRAKRLSIYIWPEGTRSRSGRLLPFKKGIVYLAEQTGLPIVPVVVEGAHEAWVKNSLKIAPVPIKVTVLPAIDTTGWNGDTAEANLATLQDAFKSVLPADQQPA